MRTKLLVTIGAVLAAGLGTVPSSAATWTPRPATYTVSLQQDVRITMSDGVRLTADVLRPATGGQPAPGTFPALLTQTPYNKSATGLNFRTDYMVTRGYVQVIVDVRGTGGSEGTWDSFGTREQLDGAELVAWVRAQPWSNGNVGLHGTSYGAINQIFTAAQQPEGLKAIFPIVPAGDVYRDIVGSGGQINVQFIPLWLGLVTGLSLLPPTYVAQDPVGALTTLAQHAGGAATFQLTQVLRGVGDAETTAYDGAFYRQRSPLEVIDRVEVPTFVVGGWFDLFQRSEPLLYRELAANGTPAKLLMGPWYHISPAINPGLPADGVPPLDQLELRWMDRYVRGDADPDLDQDVAPVTMYRLTNDGYQRFNEYPPAASRQQAFALGGSPVLGVQHGTLGPAQVPASTGDPLGQLIWQPASGGCTRSNAQWASYGPRSLCDEDERAAGVGGLTFEAALTQELVLAGPITADLVATTNDRDAFITARVEIVRSNGAVVPVSAGWQLASMRALDQSRTETRDGLIAIPYHPFTKSSELGVSSAEPIRVAVEIFPTFARLAAGDRLRLTLNSSDTPHLAPSAQRTSRLAGSVLTILEGSTLNVSVL